MSVSWTETATDQLRAIHVYLARSSLGYANALASRIIARTEELDGQPRFGFEVPEYCDEVIREIYEHPYRILYRIVNLKDVDVIAVIHSSRQVSPTLLG